MIKTSLRILGLLLMIYSLTLLPPIGFSYFYNDGALDAFVAAMTLIFSGGLLSWYLTRHQHRELRTRDGFLVVVLLWSALCIAGALPFYLSDISHIHFADAVFESVSGLTTTGSSALPYLDGLPISILYYRQQLQFLGGMGIIVLAIAILPMLGIGGLQMFKAETTGPVKDNKLTPRITQTAKALWLIYLGLTVLCIWSFWLLGMSFFDAVSYAFATVSTGGYAPHDASLGYYSSATIHLVAVFFMLLGSVNFALHFTVWQKKSPLDYWQNAEVRLFLGIIAVTSGIVFAALAWFDVHDSTQGQIVEAIVQVTSIMSTTGFTTANFSEWPSFVPYLILSLGLIGGCAGSTSGGLKLIRIQLLVKQGIREMNRLVHPNGLFAVKMGQQPVPAKVLDAVWGFVGIYLLLFALFTMLLLATGLDFRTSFSSVIASLANVGPGLGETASHFNSVNDTAKWLLSIAMLTGRLEIFTILVLFMPTFWRS